VIELGMLAQSPSALHYSTLELITLRWEQGRIEELETPLRDLKERTGAPIWRAAVALLSSETEHSAQARAELEALTADNFSPVPFDGDWLAAIAFTAMTCLKLDDSRRAAELFDLLQPYRGRYVVVGAGASCLGPVSYFLGALATVKEDANGAVALLEEAADHSRAAGSEPWLARSNCRLGMVLARRGGPGDRERSEQLVAESRATAQRLGMGLLLELIETDPVLAAGRA
jgi:hypothetical protein